MTARLERAVLACLALNVGTSVSTANLEAALWGDSEPVTSNKALQGYIVNLRKRLPEKTIETVPSGYCLQGGAGLRGRGSFRAPVCPGAGAPGVGPSRGIRGAAHERARPVAR